MVSTVHAVRSFMATQKGQVSVDPCDTLVLLSEVHWYWWFVRVCDRGVEGFVPAELLELPDERLARVNRDLNISLSIEPLLERLSKKESAKKSIRFNDTCLVSYAVEEHDYDDDELFTDASSLSLSSDDNETDSTDRESLSSLTDEVVAPQEGKTSMEKLEIRGDDSDLKHELTVRAL